MSGGRAYYNEIDPYAAQWLRNLIAAGHIAAGDVDERSIVDVRADDLRGYTQCHFFAGIGGWSLALRLAGWPDDRPVWTGSCPCQPFSAAGKQRGSDDERHLWPAFFRLIRERRPSAVFGEQVAGAAGLAWLDHVCADLEGAGYAAAAADLCAAGVGAPHIRQRLYWVAHADSSDRRKGPRLVSGQRLEGAGSVGAMANNNPPGFGQQRLAKLLDGQRPPQRHHVDRRGPDGSGLAYADGGHASAERQQRSGQQRQQPQDGGAGLVADMPEPRRPEQPQRHAGADGWPASESGRLRDAGLVADATGPRPQGREQPGQRADAQREAAERAGAAGGVGDAGSWGRPRCESFMARGRGSSCVGGHEQADGAARPGEDDFGMADAPGACDRREEDAADHGRSQGDGPADRPGRCGGASDPWSDLEWIACSDGKARPTQPGLFPLAHGIPNRVGRLRAYGNAIVPQVAAVFVMANMESTPC